MSINLYAEYLKERADSELITAEGAFATYKVLDSKTYYLVDMFVSKEFRKTGKAWKLHNLICDVARSAGAAQLLTSVCTNANNVTESIAVIIAGGFKYASTSGTMIYFIKDL